MNTINGLLLNPNPDSPLNHPAANLIKQDKLNNTRTYLKTARQKAEGESFLKPPNWYL